MGVGAAFPGLAGTLRPGWSVQTFSAAGSSLTSPGAAMRGSVPKGGGSSMYGSSMSAQLDYNSLAGFPRVSTDSQPVLSKRDLFSVPGSQIDLG